MKQKKICIIGSAHPFRGGLAAYNERLCREFVRSGDDAYIETFTLQYPSILFPGKTQFTDDPAPNDIIIRRSINSINPFNWLSAGNKIRKQKPDIILVNYWLPFMGPAFGTILRIVKKNKYSRIIAIVHNIIPHERRVGDTLFTRYFVKPVDSFLTMSKQVLKELDHFNKFKARVYSPHPIYDHYGEAIEKNTAREKLKLETNRPVILFFGFIRSYKGLDLLLKAVSEQKVKALGIQTVVAGEYYESSAPYDTIIQKNDLSKSVVVHSKYIPDADVALYFSAADLIVQPYKTATQSGVTQIAYHFEKPMIVTNVGGLPEILENEKCGFVVEPEPHEIANAIVKFFQNTDKIDFSVNLKEAKKRFSWAEMRNKILDIAEN